MSETKADAAQAPNTGNKIIPNKCKRRVWSGTFASIVWLSCNFLYVKGPCNWNPHWSLPNRIFGLVLPNYTVRCSTGDALNDKISLNKMYNIYVKKLNKMNDQARCLKILKLHFFVWTEGVISIDIPKPSRKQEGKRKIWKILDEALSVTTYRWTTTSWPTVSIPHKAIAKNINVCSWKSISKIYHRSTAPAEIHARSHPFPVHWSDGRHGGLELPPGRLLSLSSPTRGSSSDDEAAAPPLLTSQERRP